MNSKRLIEKNRRAFTLVELLLYSAIAGVVVLTTSVLVAVTLQARVKSQTVTEVEQQGLQVMQIITQTIRNAQTINSPNQGDTATSLSIKVPAPNNPTIFDLSSGVVRITEGAGSPVSLTSSKLTASALSFTNLSKDVRITFTLSYTNPGGRNEYSFSKTFYGSSMVRTP